MSSGPPLTTIPDETDSQFDLSTVFSHPAGLRVAKYVVRSCIRAAQDILPIPPPSAEDSIHAVPIPTFEPSSEVTKLLQTILTLSDSEVDTSEGYDARLEELSMEGPQHGKERSIDDYSSAFNSSQPELYSSSSKQTRNDFFATSNNRFSTTASHPMHNFSSIFSNSIHTSSASHSQLDQALRPLVMNSRPGLPGSLTPGSGSDSPYRIESPSRSSTNNTPQPQALPGGSSLPVTDLFAGSDLLASRLPPMRKSLSSDSTSSRHDGASAISYQRGTSFSAPGHQIATAPSSTSPTIKSFMPVNKTTEGASSTLAGTKLLTGDNHLFADRAMAPGHNMTSSSATSEQTPNQFCSLAAQRSFGSAGAQSAEMERTPSASSGQKRKGESEHIGTKKEKTEKGSKRIVKLKEPKPEPAAHKLGPDLWMRILEFTPPTFIRKARLLNRDFKTWIDGYSSIFVNQRLENYGQDMPPASAIQVYLNFDDESDTTEVPAIAALEDSGSSEAAALETPVKKLVKKKQDISERQYNDLLGGKGCLEKEKEGKDGSKEPCDDTKASRTHWSWAQRWCWSCWKDKIEREDRILKTRQNHVGRQVLQDLLACIPNGIHDSFMKPHDYVTEEESRDRPRGAPRLYRYYLRQDVDLVIAEYEKRTPLPYVDDPSISAAANASAKAVHQIKETALIQKRQDWVDKMKARNAAWMETVKKIEAAVRKRREENGEPHENYRAARKELFTRRAKEDLPHIPTEFVERTKAYKAATRIFRDGGTERGWQTLKPKIEKEWQTEQSKQSNINASAENEENEVMDVEGATSNSFEVENGNMRSHSNAGLMNHMHNMQAHIMHRQLMQQQQLAQHQAQRSSMHGLPTNMNRHSFINRYRVQAQAQQNHSLAMLAAVADLAPTNTSHFANSSYNGFGSTNSFPAQPSSHHNEMFASMRFDQPTHNGGQSGYTQYPSSSSRPMYQNTPSQEPARTGLSIDELLADPPSNSGRKPSHFHQSY